MKRFFLGLIVGLVIGAITVAYADVGVLFGSDNIEKGTASNPLYIENVD
jgi:uncharacterized membrane protein